LREKQQSTGKVINLMDALRKSLSSADARGSEEASGEREGRAEEGDGLGEGHGEGFREEKIGLMLSFVG
jgi:hypothetical protein